MTDERVTCTQCQLLRGGWCRIRERCPHFHAVDRRAPAERLCVPGSDGVGIAHPVVVRMPAGSWERGAAALLAPAQPLELA